jgi:hypothetical protein
VEWKLLAIVQFGAKNSFFCLYLRVWFFFFFIFMGFCTVSCPQCLSAVFEGVGDPPFFSMGFSFPPLPPVLPIPVFQRGMPITSNLSEYVVYNLCG